MGKRIKIVALGDSMTDTAGDGCPELYNELKRFYPEKDFEIYNYGVGGTRVGYGLWRLTNDYEFNSKKYKALVKLNPDVVLVESFAYNNGSDGPRENGLPHFRKMHLEIIKTIREKTNAKIVYVVTIAPDKEHFLESVPSFYNTPVSIRKWMAEDRMVYLEETIKLANDLNLPLVNVYQASLDEAEQGTPLGKWINPKDWIHPGKKGHWFIAKNIVKVLIEKNII